jgi:hypothetical protein
MPVQPFGSSSAGLFTTSPLPPSDRPFPKDVSSKSLFHSTYERICTRLELPVQSFGSNSTGPFTTSPLPPPSDRPFLKDISRRLGRRSCQRQPETNHKCSQRGASQRNDTQTFSEDIWVRRPSLAGHTSAPNPSSTVPPSAAPISHSYQSMAKHDISPSRSISTGTGIGVSMWGQRQYSVRHKPGPVSLVPPSVPQPTPSQIAIPAHHEQVLHNTPLNHFPLGGATAWDQAALNIVPQQPYHEDNHSDVPQIQYPSNGNTSYDYSAPEGYQDPKLGSAGVLGWWINNMYPPESGGPSWSLRQLPEPEGFYDSLDISIEYTNTALGCSHIPTPYASQASLPIHTTPSTIPIYHNDQYPTLAVEGYRLGMVYEQVHHTSGHEITDHLSLVYDEHTLTAGHVLDPRPNYPLLAPVSLPHTTQARISSSLCQPCFQISLQIDHNPSVNAKSVQHELQYRGRPADLGR